MTVTTIAQESARPGVDGFRVPTFEVRIEGVGLPRDVLRDVVELTYRDSIKEIDGFEMTVNNWDAATGAFKYVGAETTRSLRGDTTESRRQRLFEPCNKTVTVAMGYAGDLRVMLTGNVTTMEPNFPPTGAPTLTVRGLNLLHQLRRKQYSHAWTDRRDSDIAKDLEALRDDGRRRFPLPIQIDPQARDKEPEIPYVAQRSQYDIDFLLGRARQRGYVVFIQERDPLVRGSQRRLYFGPSQGRVPGLRDVTFELAWGRSLAEFRPTLTTANQVRSVQVNGWDRRTKQPIRETVTIDDPAFDRNRDLRELLGRCDPREEVVVDEPVFTRAEARRRAQAVLENRHHDLVKATGTTVGLPDLRAGKLLRITGIGARFSGTYFVTDTTHTVGSGGYRTRFSARREDQGGGGVR